MNKYLFFVINLVLTSVFKRCAMRASRSLTVILTDRMAYNGVKDKKLNKE